MTAAVGSAPHRASFGRRLYGFGSIFGKTLRDSRRAILLVGGVLAEFDALFQVVMLVL